MIISYSENKKNPEDEDIYTKFFVSATAGRPKSPRGHIYPSSTVDFGWFVAFEEHKIFRVLNFIETVILWIYYTIPFGFYIVLALFGITFHLFKLLCLAEDHWRGLSTRNALMVHIVN